MCWGICGKYGSESVFNGLEVNGCTERRAEIKWCLNLTAVCAYNMHEIYFFGLENIHRIQ